jgi:hypothetical protein
MSNTPKKESYENLREMRSSILKLKQKKYLLILEFINDFSEIKYDSLLEFKNININKINISKFESSLEKYRYKLEGELEIDLEKKEGICDILKLCTEKIYYSLHIYKLKNEKYNKITQIISIRDVIKKKCTPQKKITSDLLINFKKETTKKKKEDQKLVLEFINDATNLKLSSINKFNNINIDKINQDEFEKSVNKYKNTLEETLGFDIENTIDICEILENCFKSLGLKYIKKNKKMNNNIEIIMSIIENK